MNKISIKQKQKVDVKLLNSSNEIKVLSTKYHFLQVNPVDDEWTTRTVRVYLSDAENNIISNYQLIELSSNSENPDERKFSRVLNISENVDNSKEYNLVIEG